MSVNNKGFTLIELLVAIALVVLLMYVAITAMWGTKAKPTTVPRTYVTKVSEDNYKVNCTEFNTYYRAGDYLNIPSICFETFNITDAMIEAALKSQERVLNPCNN